MYKQVEPLGPKGGVHAAGAQAWIAPEVSHFPYLQVQTPGDADSPSLDGHHANLVAIITDERCREIAVEFRDIHNNRSTRLELTDEMAAWLTETLTQLLSRKRVAVIRGDAV